MKKSNKRIALYTGSILCILLVSIIVSYLILGWEEGEHRGKQGSSLEFVSEQKEGLGFKKEKTIYTENGIDKVSFTGKLTVDGNAEISIIDANGDSIYRKAYSNVQSKTIKLVITDLSPYSYYTMRFSSADAGNGSLQLTSKEALVKQPERPQK